MDYKCWSNTFLNVYKYLEPLANSIDKRVKHLALSSSMNYGTSSNTLTKMNHILDLMERKKNIINLKILIEEVLLRMRVDDAKILIMFYKNGLKSKDISSLLDIGQRSFFRKKKLAIDSFAKQLKTFGFDEKRFAEMFARDAWIQKAYAVINENSFNEQDVQQQHFFKSMLKDLTMPMAVLSGCI